jgi:hypothetical protein
MDTKIKPTCVLYQGNLIHLKENKDYKCKDEMKYVMKLEFKRKQ